MWGTASGASYITCLTSVIQVLGIKVETKVQCAGPELFPLCGLAGRQWGGSGALPGRPSPSSGKACRMALRGLGAPALAQAPEVGGTEGRWWLAGWSGASAVPLSWLHSISASTWSGEFCIQDSSLCLTNMTPLWTLALTWEPSLGVAGLSP